MNKALSCAMAVLMLLTPKLDRVGWIAGCWEGSRGERTFREQWLAAPGGSLVGSAETVRGGSVVEYETTRIFERNDSLVYLAQPAAQQPAEFRAADAAADSVVFENPAHDFPQRIIYVKGAADSLWARVAGTTAGAARVIGYRMRRVQCASAPADEARVLALDSLWARSYLMHDTATALQLFHENILITTARGSRGRAGELNDVRGTGYEVHYFRTREAKVRVMRDAALVTGILEWSVTYNGRRSDTRRAYGTVYRRGGDLGWAMVAMNIAAAP